VSDLSPGLVPWKVSRTGRCVTCIRDVYMPAFLGEPLWLIRSDQINSNFLSLYSLHIYFMIHDVSLRCHKSILSFPSLPGWRRSNLGYKWKKGEDQVLGYRCNCLIGSLDMQIIAEDSGYNISNLLFLNPYLYFYNHLPKCPLTNIHHPSCTPVQKKRKRLPLLCHRLSPGSLPFTNP
jgi:hypothetical protein